VSSHQNNPSDSSHSSDRSDHSHLTPDQFAAALIPIRPQLTAIALKKASCQPADAEDLVSEAVRLALLILPQYKPETGTPGLVAWLTRIVSIVIMRQRERAQRTVETVPIETAIEIPAPPPTVPAWRVLNQRLSVLSRFDRDLIRDWLRGYNHSALAGMYRLHRHTISEHLSSACSQLRAEVENGDVVSFLTSDFDLYRRAPVYRKPVGVWPSWRRRHPPERRWTLPYRHRG